MSDGMNRKKWDEMDGRQRIDYFKSYYLIPSVVIVVLFAFVSYMVYDVTFGRTEMVFHVAGVNVSVDEVEAENFSNGFVSFLQGDVSKQQATIAAYNIEDTAENSAFMTKLATGVIDCIVLDKETATSVNDFEVYADVREYVDEKKLKAIEDSVVWMKDPESGEDRPVLIDISNTDFAQKYFPNEEELYMAAVINGNYVTNMEKFVDYLLFTEDAK